jgi:non-heme chloroperoxidase
MRTRIASIAFACALIRVLTGVLTGVLTTLSFAAHAGNYVRVSPDLEIHYEEAGSGRPIIFIPGWTGTTVYMRQQIAHFSKRYRAITYDPRSHGRSSKTLENNTYTQHGHDLKAFMDALQLKDVVLVAHSWGCHDAYAYFRAAGSGNVKAYVCIDQTPKDLFEKEGDWYSLRTFGELKGIQNGIQYERVKTIREFINLLYTKPLKPEQLNSAVDEHMLTPTSAANSLNFDGYMADYTAEAKALDGKIPVLNMLAEPGWFEGWTAAAKSWLKVNAPNSEIAVLGQHNMHVEFPEKFNAIVEKFLEKVK